MIANVAMADSAHEYDILLPHGVRSYRLRFRESADMLLAEVAGGTVTGPYVTVASGSELSVNLAQIIEPNGKQFFLRCPTQAGTAEIFAW